MEGFEPKTQAARAWLAAKSFKPDTVQDSAAFVYAGDGAGARLGVSLGRAADGLGRPAAALF